MIMMLAGQTLCAISAGMLRFCNFGMDPYNSGVLGLWHMTGLLDFGTFSLIVCLLLLAIDLLFLDRKRLGIGTVYNMVIMGYVIDFTYKTLKGLLPDASIAVRIIFLFAGLSLLCYSSSMYHVADMGVSPYDCIPLSISERVRFRFRTVRLTSDCIMVLIGLIGRQMPGVTTIITALCLGPFIELFNPLNRRLIGEEKKDMKK